jgi:cell wall assembly regulator SMI1
VAAQARRAGTQAGKFDLEPAPVLCPEGLALLDCSPQPFLHNARMPCRREAQIVAINHMWTEIVKQVVALSPGVLAGVNPPAAPGAIDALERRIGAPLPDGFKQYLAVMDGQNDVGRDHPLVGYNRFLPIADIIETMDMSRFHFGDEDRIGWMTENKIQPVMWDSRWVPFSDFQGSPRLILDLHPGRNGTYGQVWQDWPGRDREDDGTVIATSFGAFSAELLRRLTTGSVTVDDDGILLFAHEGRYFLV